LKDGDSKLVLGHGTIGSLADWATNTEGGTKKITVLSALGTTFDTQDVNDAKIGYTITLNHNITGAGKIVKTGDGTLVFNGTASDFSGGTDITRGAVKANASLGTGVVTLKGDSLSSKATLDIAVANLKNNITVEVGKFGFLTGANVGTYAGDLTVNGALMIQGETASAKGLTLGATGSLDLGGINTAETLTVSGPLALGGAASSILMDVGTATDKIVYANAANPIGNNVTLDLNIVGATVGTAYTIIQTTGTGALTLDMFTKHILNRGAEANLTLNADNDLIVTVTNAGAAADLTWAGTAGFNTWKTLGDSTPWTGGNTDNQFYAGDKVTFADAGTTKTVNIVGDVAPGSITITGNNYVLSGTGGIIGNGAMTVNIGGADALKQATLNTSNAKYTGKITLTSGTLILGATNAAGTGDISFDGGTLYIGADNALNGNIISATTGKTINLGVAAGGSYALGNVNLSSVAFTKVGEG
ncbi:MAG: autotransporter-associated beta strand repeat-containing protein, partial [Akkermansia sp.]